jgi:hypothetical protein
MHNQRLRFSLMMEHIPSSPAPNKTKQINKILDEEK